MTAKAFTPKLLFFPNAAFAGVKTFTDTLTRGKFVDNEMLKNRSLIHKFSARGIISA
jgi:hypothetical protein